MPADNPGRESVPAPSDARDDASNPMPDKNPGRETFPLFPAPLPSFSVTNTPGEMPWWRGHEDDLEGRFSLIELRSFPDHRTKEETNEFGLKKPNRKILTYTDNTFIETTAELDFDNKHNDATSVTYLATALISGVLHQIRALADKRQLRLYGLEGLLKLRLAHPLAYLGVRGYQDEKARFDAAYLMVYMASDLDEEESKALVQEACAQSLVFQTLAQSVAMTVDCKADY